MQRLRFRRKVERLVHISQLGREGRVTNVEQVVNRGDTVKAKVLSASGCNISLSMNDVDQIIRENVNTIAKGGESQDDELEAC